MFKTFAFRHPRLILVAWTLPALAGAIVFLGRFSLDNSVGVWFPEDDPALAGYERHLETFGPWEWTLLLVEPAPSPRALSSADADSLTHRLASLSVIRQVLPPQVLYALSGKSPGDSPPPAGLPFLLETANEIHRGDDYRAELLERIQAEVESFPGIASHAIVGTSTINVGLNRSAKRDMLLFFNLVFVLLFAVCAYLLRSLKDTLAILGVAVSAVTLTLGLVSVLGHRFNILTIMMPTLLIALSVANLIHLVHAFHQNRRMGESVPRAADLAVREVRLPSLGATLTTVLGFLSLTVSDMPPVRDLAIFSACGITVAWIGTLGVAPTLLVCIWKGSSNVPAAAATRHRLLEAWAFRSSRFGPLLVILGVLSLPVLAGLTRLDADTNYMEFFRPGSDTREAYRTVQAAGLSQSSLEVTLRSSRPVEPLELGPFLESLRLLPEIRALLAPGAPPGLPGFRNEGEHALRVVLFLNFLGNDAVGELGERIRGLALDRLPRDVGIEVTGSPVLWERMDASIVRTQRDSILIVALGTFVLLALLFRSLRAAVVGWISCAYPVGIILGLMAWLGVPVTLATVLIAGITLGLAVDDTVHLVIDYRRRRGLGVPCEEASRNSLVHVGERMVVTSLILAGSFSVMALSDFTPTASFGIFTAFTILLALAADLTFLPWALGWSRLWGASPRVSTNPHTGVHVPTPPGAPSPSPAHPAKDASALASEG